MRIGITGTRYKPAFVQLEGLYNFLTQYYEPGSVIHQGCCTGFDESSVAIGSTIGYKIIGHPPKNQIFLTNKHILDMCHEMRTPKEYLARNQDIVDDCTLLIAAPAKKEDDNPQSGTWQTVRYAKSIKRSLIILYNDGKVEEYFPI